jgi:hypothetical protein
MPWASIPVVKFLEERRCVVLTLQVRIDQPLEPLIHSYKLLIAFVDPRTAPSQPLPTGRLSSRRYNEASELLSNLL